VPWWRETRAMDRAASNLQPLSPLLVGLTGGIASGKSLVARLLRDELGLWVVDADTLARRVVALGRPALAQVRGAFGDDVVTADGSLDRAALGRRVFADRAARARLEGILHPAIEAELAAEVRTAGAAGHPVVVYDAALLVETGRSASLAALIVVACPRSCQKERLMARSGLDEAAAEARLRAQAPLAAKLALADWVVDNSGSPDATRAQVLREGPAFFAALRAPGRPAAPRG